MQGDKNSLLNKLVTRLRPANEPLDVLSGYACWAGSYLPEAHNPLMAAEQAAMLSLLPPELAGVACLDLACGSGRYLQLLRERGACRPVGLDLSEEMLAQARRYQVGLALVRAPFLALPFAGGTFDLITCGLAVGHEPALAHVLAEAARVLRPGGQLLYSDVHPLGTLSGWRRTFTTPDGAVHSLEHHLHLYGDHHRAAQTAGLAIEAVLEPTAGPAAPERFRQFPAVLVIRAVKLRDNFLA
jgi:malonyl-CoA O-methyltransferase